MLLSPEKTTVMNTARQHRGGARAAWLKIHLYLGLFAGALLVLLAVTGSALVFGEEIDRFLNPQIVASGAPHVSPDVVVEAVEHHYGRRPYYIETAGGGAYKAFIEESPGRTDEVRAIWVDPADGRVLTSEPWGGYFSSFMRELHEDLFLGETGHYIVGAVSILTLVSILTGLYLWWPRAGALRKALLFRWSRYPLALNFEIHRVCGFYLAAVLFVIALAGIYLTFPEPVTSAVGSFSRATPSPDHVTSAAPSPGVQPLSVAEVRRVLEEHAPGAEVTGYQMPQTSDEAYAVYYRDPAEPYSRFGLSTLWIDQYSGEVLAAREYVRSGTADRYLSSQYMFHNGEILGLPGRWLVFITGLAIPVMYGTGFYLWWRRRHARQVRASGAKTA